MRTARFSPLSALAIFVAALASSSWVLLALPAGSPAEVWKVVHADSLEFGSPGEYTPHGYIEILGGCGPHYEGNCVISRAGPGSEYRAVARLRHGIVLKVEKPVLREMQLWYKVVFDEPVRYPERAARSQYVLADERIRHFYGDTVAELSLGMNTSVTKHIIVDRSEQVLYAYEGDELVRKVVISTGLDITPTPRGTFTLYKKTPTRYMQGPLPGISAQHYDLPGVPWNLYFTKEGAVIHGAYWHDSFGRKWSNGCVNVPLAEAQALYEWAELGMRVVVRD